MKKILSALSTLVLTTTLAFVGKVEADTSFDFGVGYRTDNIVWDTKVPDNVLFNSWSKLNFKDLEIFTLQARLKGSCGECIYYRLDGQYGWILDGTVRESDQIAIPTPPVPPNTLTPVVRAVTHNDIKGKYVADFNFAVGYPIQQCWCPGLQLTPTIGFSYNTQRVSVENDELLDDVLSPTDFAALLIAIDADQKHSKYRTTWWGPWLGFDVAWSHHDCWNLYGEFEFHFGRARRERNSVTGIDYLDDFERTRKGCGVNIRVGSIYFFRCNWFLDGHISFTRWYSNEHRDQIRWRSLGVGVDLGYMF